MSPKLEIAMCEKKRGRRGRETEVHYYRVPAKEGAACLCGERKVSAEMAAEIARAAAKPKRRTR